MRSVKLVGLSALTALVLVAAGAGASGPPDTLAMDPAAKEHLEHGAAQYEAKRYEAAIREFRAGYSIEPRAEFLFAWAQSERLRGNCPAAVDLYEKFLSTEPPKQQADVARYHLGRCKPLVPRPWYTDVTGGLLTVSGIAFVAIGAGFYALSVGDENAAPGASSYAEHESLIDAARTKRAVGIGGLGLGSALVLGGVVRYISRAKPPRPADVGMLVGPTHVTVTFSRAF